jgi:hypothetical protein
MKTSLFRTLSERIRRGFIRRSSGLCGRTISETRFRVKNRGRRDGAPLSQSALPK